MKLHLAPFTIALIALLGTACDMFSSDDDWEKEFNSAMDDLDEEATNSDETTAATKEQEKVDFDKAVADEVAAIEAEKANEKAIADAAAKASAAQKARSTGIRERPASSTQRNTGNTMRRPK